MSSIFVSIVTVFITGIFLNFILKLKKEEVQKQTNNGRLYYTKSYNNILITLAFISFFFIMALHFIIEDSSLIFCILLLCLFELPIFALYLYSYTSYIDYDEFGILKVSYGFKRKIKYQDICGVNYNGHTLILKLINNKHLKISKAFISLNKLYEQIQKHNIPKINGDYSFMSFNEVEKLSKSGELIDILIMSDKTIEDNQSIIKNYKILEIFSTAIAFIPFLLLYFFSEYINMNSFSTFGVFIIIIVLVLNYITIYTFYLYFKFPNIFTLKYVNQIALSKDVQNKHKITISLLFVSSSFIYNTLLILYFMSATDTLNKQITAIPYISIAAMFTILYVSKLLFQKLAYEYKQYRIGLYTFIFYAFIYIFPLLMLVSSFELFN